MKINVLRKSIINCLNNGRDHNASKIKAGRLDLLTTPTISFHLEDLPRPSLSPPKPP